MNSNDLNKHPGIVLWFDDLGSGNEEFRFLSNFYEGAPLTLPGVTWEALMAACGLAEKAHRVGRSGPVEFLTGEHAFAAMKFWGTDWSHFADIVEADDPNTAKGLGRSRKHPLREDWEIVKLDVMAAVIRAKFDPDREETAFLLKTGDKMLVEGTWWGDDVWGVALDEAGQPGRNWLGTLLMARRAELRALDTFVIDPGEDETRFLQHFAFRTGLHNSEFVR